ncbi:hypothetical protein SUGI_1129490 [Cryptomeria japonica]|nr:hypothetical protein SUGI_1129490 [Cryptomeria japonica]
MTSFGYRTIGCFPVNSLHGSSSANHGVLLAVHNLNVYLMLKGMGIEPVLSACLAWPITKTALDTYIRKDSWQ